MRKSLKEAVDFGKVAEKAVAIIKGKGHKVVMFTDDGMETSDPEAARRLYVKEPNYMITIEPESAQLRLNKNSHVELNELEGVMKQIKNLARNYMLKYELKVFGKEIAPKDFAYQAKKLRDQKMNGIKEASFSPLHGHKKTSYQTLESTKIVVRHRRPVDEEKHGARSRQIKEIFIERAGERFRFPHNYLPGARAMARHMDEGGEMYDTVGKYIVESVENLKKLSEFVRYTRTNKLINEQSEDIVKVVRENIAAYKRELQKFTGATTYPKMVEQVSNREGSEIEEDTAELKDMFTVRKFDEKIGETLPLIKRLVTEKNAWRSMIEEASTEAFSVTSTEDLIENDAIEFDSPTQKLGYKIRTLSERVTTESELSKLVHRIGNKLIEGNDLSKFEKTVMRNVLENITVAEETTEEDGLVDKMEEALSAYEAKVSELAEARYDPQEEVSGPCRWWAMCDNDATTTEPHPILGDVPICDRCVDKLRKIEGMERKPELDEELYGAELDAKEVKDIYPKEAVIYMLKDYELVDDDFVLSDEDYDSWADMYAKNDVDNLDGDGYYEWMKDFVDNYMDVPVSEDPGDWDHGYNYEGPNRSREEWDAEMRRGESEAGCGMGYPMCDEGCPACGSSDWDVQDSATCDNCGYSEDSMYAMGEDVDRMLELAGIPVKEGIGDWMSDKMLNMLYKRFEEEGPEACALEIVQGGRGKVDSLKRILKDWQLRNMEKELGSDKYMFFIKVSALLKKAEEVMAVKETVDPEDFMDKCENCSGTGTSDFSGEECQDCGGEGYV